MTNLVANTILHQLGGHRFIAMTGAKNFSSADRGLSFSLSSTSTKNKCNFVNVELLPNDSYTIEFGKLVKFQYKQLTSFSGVYFDNLVRLFESETGLYTKLF